MDKSNPYPDQIRWQQRFENYMSALASLRAALKAVTQEPDNQLYRIALIGAFTFTYELGWKTLKDYLKFGGITVNLPRDVIKQAFSSGLIADGQTWIAMMEDRNLMVHIYDEKTALAAIENIRTRYILGLEQVYDLLKQKMGS